MDKNTKTVDISELASVMCLLDSARTIMGDIQQEYFDALSPQEDRASIIYDFPRQRAMFNAAAMMIFDIEKDLKNLGAATGYR